MYYNDINNTYYYYYYYYYYCRVADIYLRQRLCSASSGSLEVSVMCRSTIFGSSHAHLARSASLRPETTAPSGKRRENRGLSSGLELLGWMFPPLGSGERRHELPSGVWGGSPAGNALLLAYVDDHRTLFVRQTNVSHLNGSSKFIVHCKM